MNVQTKSLSARLTTLSENNKATLQLINQLARINSQPGSTARSSDDGDLRVELSSDIHDGLKQQEEELELLKSEIDDATIANASSLSDSAQHHRNRQQSEQDNEKRRLSIQFTRLGEDIKQSRAQFRRAQLQAKRNAELARQQEREQLFASIRDGSNNQSPAPGRKRGAGQEKLTAEELTANASSDVTAALRRTRQLLQTELSRSEFAQQTLEESSRALADLSERYTDLDSLLSSSRTLLSTLVRSQKSDTWYLETAVFVLLATIAWLVFRRFLYGPAWWLLYLPLKLAFRFVTLVLGAVGVSSSSSAAVSSSSRTPLIVKPSATGRSQPRVAPADGQQPNIPVGRGGYGAGQRADPSVEGSLSQQVGQMAEASKEAEKKPVHADESQAEGQGEGGDAKQGEQVVRGDGTVLEGRKADQPKNPKKKVWDEEAERAKAEQRQRDEL